MPKELERCVLHVMGKGHDKKSAYAICTAAMEGKDKAKEAAVAAGVPEGAAVSLAEQAAVLASSDTSRIAEMEMSKLEDDDLRSMRQECVDARIELQKEFQDLDDDRYSTPEGQQLQADIRYYDGCISRCESEMQYRMLML